MLLDGSSESSQKAPGVGKGNEMSSVTCSYLYCRPCPHIHQPCSLSHLRAQCYPVSLWSQSMASGYVVGSQKSLVLVEAQGMFWRSLL